MGKVLIIKNADFHENAVEGGGTVVTLTPVFASLTGGSQYIHYPDTFIHSLRVLSGHPDTQVATIDVSQYQGHTIEFSYGVGLNDYGKSVQYVAFVSTLPFTPPYNGSPSGNNAITPISSIDVPSSGTGVEVPVRTTIPEGANYIIGQIYPNTVARIID